MGDAFIEHGIGGASRSVSAEMLFDLELGPLGDAGVLAASLYAPVGRALIVAPDLSDRLYLRARLALARFPVADEAQNVDEALHLLGLHAYRVAVVNLALPEGDALALIRALHEQDEPPQIIATGAHVPWLRMLGARWAGADTVMRWPPQPKRLQALFSAVPRERAAALQKQ